MAVWDGFQKKFQILEKKTFFFIFTFNFLMILTILKSICQSSEVNDFKEHRTILRRSFSIIRVTITILKSIRDDKMGPKGYQGKEGVV